MSHITVEPKPEEVSSIDRRTLTPVLTRAEFRFWDANDCPSMLTKFLIKKDKYVCLSMYSALRMSKAPSATAAESGARLPF
jgi:hypothetical protein